MELDTIPVFIKVVQAKSFSQAARELGIPNTTVSAQIARLEKSLGMTLIQRTTRQLIITPAGQTFYEGCLRAMNEIEATQAQLESAISEPSGTLRVSAASDVAHSILLPIIKKYLQTYPKTKVDLVITTRLVDLLKEGVDVVIRPGNLADSSLVAKKLVNVEGGLYASESYLRRVGTPNHPKDLIDHEWILLKLFSSQELKLSNKKEEVTLRPASRLIADELEVIREFSLQGMGIAILPDFMASQRQGSKTKLVRVLPKWNWIESKLSLVYPPQKFIIPRLRAFIDIATTYQGE